MKFRLGDEEVRKLAIPTMALLAFFAVIWLIESRSSPKSPQPAEAPVVQIVGVVFYHEGMPYKFEASISSPEYPAVPHRGLFLPETKQPGTIEVPEVWLTSGEAELSLKFKQGDYSHTLYLYDFPYWAGNTLASFSVLVRDGEPCLSWQGRAECLKPKLQSSPRLIE